MLWNKRLSQDKTVSDCERFHSGFLAVNWPVILPETCTRRTHRKTSAEPYAKESRADEVALAFESGY